MVQERIVRKRYFRSLDRRVGAFDEDFRAFHWFVFSQLLLLFVLKLIFELCLTCINDFQINYFLWLLSGELVCKLVFQIINFFRISIVITIIVNNIFCVHMSRLLQKLLSICFLIHLTLSSSIHILVNKLFDELCTQD